MEHHEQSSIYVRMAYLDTLRDEKIRMTRLSHPTTTKIEGKRLLGWPGTGAANLFIAKEAGFGTGSGFAGDRGQQTRLRRIVGVLAEIIRPPRDGEGHPGLDRFETVQHRLG